MQQRHFGVVRLVQNQTGFARRIVTFQFDDNTRVSRSERKSEIARKRISVCAEILRASAVGYLANCVFSLRGGTDTKVCEIRAFVYILPINV